MIADTNEEMDISMDNVDEIPLKTIDCSAQDYNEEEEHTMETDNLPTIPNTLHKKPLQRKIPPHMRRLNMR